MSLAVCFPFCIRSVGALCKRAAGLDSRGAMIKTPLQHLPQSGRRALQARR